MSYSTLQSPKTVASALAIALREVRKVHGRRDGAVVALDDLPIISSKPGAQAGACAHASGVVGDDVVVDVLAGLAEINVCKASRSNAHAPRCESSTMLRASL